MVTSRHSSSGYISRPHDSTFFLLAVSRLFFFMRIICYLLVVLRRLLLQERAVTFAAILPILTLFCTDYALSFFQHFLSPVVGVSVLAPSLLLFSPRIVQFFSLFAVPLVIRLTAL